jgi:membrane protease YdiL (CAAX protease family)
LRWLTKVWQRLPLLVRAILAGAFVTDSMTLPVASFVLGYADVGARWPWSAPLGLAWTWVTWRYWGGVGPPAATSEARRRARRAHALAPASLAASCVAGLLWMAAAQAFGQVVGRFVEFTPDSMPDLSSFGPAFLSGAMSLTAINAGFAEELGLRGYLQGALERRTERWWRSRFRASSSPYCTRATGSCSTH